MTINPPHPRRIVLFDLDGTLLDTPRAIAEQLIEAVNEVTGQSASLEFAQSLIGRPLPEICATLSGHLEGTTTVNQVVEVYRELYRKKVVPAAKELMFEGVETGLRFLRDSGIELAVVTSKQSDSAKLILESAGISSLFETVVGVDETENAKPHPDPALLALSRLSADKANAIMVGDSLHDLNMARSVPLQSIAVTYGVGTATELQTADPTTFATTFDQVISQILDMSNTENELVQ